MISVCCALSMAAAAQAAVVPGAAQDCQTIPDPVGRAGMAAVLLPPNANHDMPVIMMTGGANFPYAKPNAKTPAERGDKVYYPDIAVMMPPGSCAVCDSAPMNAGRLPQPIGYAAFAPSDKGMVVAGGCNARGHVSSVTRSELYGGSARTEALPDLPVTVAYPAFAVLDDKLYVLGGQEKAESTTCLARCFALDLKDTDAGWKELAPMPEPRILAGAAAVDGKIYVAGGCSLHPDAKGAAERTYLTSVLRYDPATDSWESVDAPMPESIVGAANPLPVVDGKMYVICGDPGNYYRASLAGKAPAEHPGQNKTVYSFEPATGQWTKEGENTLGIATCPAVPYGKAIYSISGETHPGIRTPLISTINITD